MRNSLSASWRGNHHPPAKDGVPEKRKIAFVKSRKELHGRKKNGAGDPFLFVRFHRLQSAVRHISQHFYSVFVRRKCLFECVDVFNIRRGSDKFFPIRLQLFQIERAARFFDEIDRFRRKSDFF